MDEREEMKRHDAAVADPRVGFERAICRILAGFEEYRAAHLAAYESGIGDDRVLGDDWAALGCALHGLLNGETGRLHCATLSTRIHAALRAEGFEESKGWRK